MFSLCGKNFVLAKVGLVRAGCPQELIGTPTNRSLEAAIVIVANKAKLGYIEATGYYPKGVIVAGAMRRLRLQEAGVVSSWAYVEAGLDIRADDTIDCSEFMGKLDELTVRSIYSGKPVTGQPWPYITEVYPFENKFTYAVRGERYIQSYAIDPIAKRIVLRGGGPGSGPQPGNGMSSDDVQKLSDALMKRAKVPNYPRGGAMGDLYSTKVTASTESMSRVQTGVRYAYAPAKGNNQTFTTGGANSELVTCLIRNIGNVLEAVNAYLSYCRESGAVLKPPMKPAFSPAKLSSEEKVIAALIARGIDPYDFAKWSSGVQGRKKKVKGPLTSTTGLQMRPTL